MLVIPEPIRQSLTQKVSRIGAAAVLCVSCSTASVEPVSVSSVQLSQTSVELVVGQTLKLTADLKSVEGWTLPSLGVVWSTSNSAVATISTDGTITAVMAGSAQIIGAVGGESASAAVTVTGGAANPFSVGLRARYPLDGNALDISGNGNHGVVLGGVVATGNRLGQSSRAMTFDGTDGRIRVTTLDGIPFYPITYSAWILSAGDFAATVPEAARLVVGRDQSCSGQQGALMMYHKPSTGVSNQLLYYRGVDAVRSDYVIAPGQWIHVALTIEENGRHIFYVGGSKVRDTTSFSPGVPPLPFMIGAGTIVPSCAGGSLRHLWKGSIDDIAVWSRALSAAEVAAVAGAPPF